MVQAPSAGWIVEKKVHRLSILLGLSVGVEGAMRLPGGWGAGPSTSHLLLWVLPLAVPVAGESRKV